MTDYVLSAELSLKDKFTSKIKSAEYKSKLFNKTLKQNKSIFQKVKSASLFAASGVRKFADNVGNTYKKTEKLRKSLNKLGKGIQDYGKGFDKFVLNGAKKGMLAVGAGVTGLSAFAVKGAADMEKYRATLDTVFKDDKKSSEYMSWANDFADATPYSNDEVVSSVAKLASYGIDPKLVLKELGDMSASMGKPLDQAVEAFADAKTGELERLKEFGIKKEDVKKFAKEKMGINPAEFINKQETITDYGKFTDALVALMVDKFKDGMKKQSDTFYGATSTIFGIGKSGITTMLGMDREGKARAGSFWEFIKKQTLSLRDYMDGLKKKNIFEEWGKKLDEELVPKFKKFIEDAKIKFKEMKEDGTLEEWANNMKNAFNSALESINSLKESLSGVANIIETLNNSSIFKWFLKHGLGLYASVKGGTMAGAALGSIVPGAGTATGAGIGGLAGGVVYIGGSFLNDFLLDEEGNPVTNNNTDNSSTNTNTIINNTYNNTITVNDKNSEMLEEMRKNLGIVNGLSY